MDRASTQARGFAQSFYGNWCFCRSMFFAVEQLLVSYLRAGRCCHPRGGGVRVAGNDPARRPEGDGTGPCASRDDPAQAAEDRDGDRAQHATHPALLRARLSVPGTLREGLRDPEHGVRPKAALSPARTLEGSGVVCPNASKTPKIAPPTQQGRTWPPKRLRTEADEISGLGLRGQNEHGPAAGPRSALRAAPGQRSTWPLAHYDDDRLDPPGWHHRLQGL